MDGLNLDERFTGAALPAALTWFCEPEGGWSLGVDRLELRPAANTDFWQRTHYGFEADNGHFLHARTRGDFVMTTQVTTHPRHQYDQAGLMVRLSPACWLKTSVEFEPDEPNRLGAVVTNAQYSDWSTQSIDKAVRTVWFRLSMTGPDCLVESSFDGTHWQQIRLARLTAWNSAAGVDCGLYACSPKAAGFQADFHFLRIEPR